MNIPKTYSVFTFLVMMLGWKLDRERVILNIVIGMYDIII